MHFKLNEERVRSPKCQRGKKNFIYFFQGEKLCKTVMMTVGDLASVSEKHTGSGTHCVPNGSSISLCNVPQPSGGLKSHVTYTLQGPAPAASINHPPGKDFLAGLMGQSFL